MALILRIPSRPAYKRAGAVNPFRREAGARRSLLRKLVEGVTAAWLAVAFAEENEPATARQLLRSGPTDRRR